MQTFIVKPQLPLNPLSRLKDGTTNKQCGRAGRKSNDTRDDLVEAK